MNTKHLSEWVKSLKSTGLSYESIAKRIGGVTGGTVSNWARERVSSIDPAKLTAISLFRGESVEETCQWLEVPVPEGSGLADKVKRLEDAVEKILDLLESVSKQLAYGVLRPSPLAVALQDELISSYYDIREKHGQEEFLVRASKALGSRVDAQKVLIQIIGAAPIEPTDYPMIAHAMASILGEKWTMLYLVSLVDKKPMADFSPSDK